MSNPYERAGRQEKVRKLADVLAAAGWRAEHIPHADKPTRKQAEQAAGVRSASAKTWELVEEYLAEREKAGISNSARGISNSAARRNKKGQELCRCGKLPVSIQFTGIAVTATRGWEQGKRHRICAPCYGDLWVLGATGAATKSSTI